MSKGWKSLVLGLAAWLMLPALAWGATSFTCPNAGIFNELIGGVCWNQMFPIRLAGVTMFGGSGGVPNGSDSQIMCICGGSLKHLTLPEVGVTVGFWQPAFLMEATSHPFCFPSLGGIDIGGEDTGGIALSGSWGGNIADHTGMDHGDKNGYFNVHLLSFPLLWMMNIMNVPNCNGGFSGMDVILQSEFYPTWNNDLLAMLESPEEVLFANTVGMIAEAGECAAETAGAQPIDDMYFTAGCWGLLYPMVGSNLVDGDPIRTSSLDTARLLALGFRLGLLKRTVGKSVVCGPKRTYVLDKQQFREQILFPNDETGNNPNPGVPTSVQQSGGVNVIASPVQSNGCTHWIGQTPLTWGEWDDQPGTGENYVYLLWEWSDCCLGVLGGET